MTDLLVRVDGVVFIVASAVLDEQGTVKPVAVRRALSALRLDSTPFWLVVEIIGGSWEASACAHYVGEALIVPQVARGYGPSIRKAAERACAAAGVVSPWEEKKS